MLIYNKICFQQILNKRKRLLKRKGKRHTATPFLFLFVSKCFVNGFVERLLMLYVAGCQCVTFPEYASFLPSDVQRISFPIRNCDVPSSVESVMDLFRRLEQLMHEQPRAKLYIHCHGGVGRTGIIVACYYIYFEHLSFEEALDKMGRQYAQSPRSKFMNAPETKRQIEYVKEFAEYSLI